MGLYHSPSAHAINLPRAQKYFPAIVSKYTIIVSMDLTKMRMKLWKQWYVSTYILAIPAQQRCHRSTSSIDITPVNCRPKPKRQFSTQNFNFVHPVKFWTRISGPCVHNKYRKFSQKYKHNPRKHVPTTFTFNSSVYAIFWYINSKTLKMEIFQILTILNYSR